MAALEVTTTGPALASLLYDVATSGGALEGLLFGTVTQRETREVRDHGVSVHEVRRVAIWSYVPTGATCSFYSPDGELDVDALEALCACQAKSLIGWFRFRRNTPLRPALRELSVHDQLASFAGARVSRSAAADWPGFVFGLLSAVCVDDTLSHDYRFFARPLATSSTHDASGASPGPSAGLAPLELSIANLVDSHGGYQNFTPLTPAAFCTSATSQNLASQASRQAEDAVRGVELLCECLLREVAAASDDVVDSSAELLALEARVEALRARQAARLE